MEGLWTTVEAFSLCEMGGGLVSRGSITNTDSWRQYLDLETLLRR